MSVGPDLPPDPGRRAPFGPNSVAGDLAAIFAEPGSPTTPAGSASKVRAVTGQRSRPSYATLGAIAAAGLVGLTAGSAFMGARSKPAAAPAQPAAPAAQPTLAVQVAAAPPTVTLSPSHGPVPVLDTAPVAPARAAHASNVRRAHAQARRGPPDLMSADRKLRTAYSHAVRAGVPRHVLVAYRDRWADLREDAVWRPARVAVGYGEMTADLERLARRSHGQHPPPPRRGLFGLFS